MSVDQTRYRNIVSVIIDQLEGGYYNPAMLTDGRVTDSRYGNSGETMFGIDRKAGGAINTTAKGQYFWSLIDNANAKNTWPWNYMGGSLQQPLKDAAADMMYPQYNTYANQYLSSQSKNIIESDDRLLFNFIYATWNGPGWFKKFAKDFDEAVNSGTTNPDDLVNVVLKSRADSQNSLIIQGGKKIAAFINNLARSVTSYVKNNPTYSSVIIAALAGMGIYYVWLIRSKKLIG